MKIFITGGSGFIGLHLIKVLVKEKEEIFALARNQKSAEFLADLGVKPIISDLNSISFLKKALKDIDIVYHLAALRGEWHRKKDFYQNNVLTTKNMLQASLGSVKHFIFLSSVSVLGYPKKLPANETYPLKPETLYAKSKAAGEKYAHEFSKMGLPITIVRPSVVYGPGDRTGMILKLAKLIKKGSFPIIGGGKSKLHLIYIDDLIAGLVKIKKQKPSGEAYILAGEGPIEVKKLIEIISKILRVNPPSFKISTPLAKAAGFLGEGLSLFGEPPISRHKVDIFTKNQVYNIEKAKKELNFKPRVNYQEGMEKTLKWEQENGYL